MDFNIAPETNGYMTETEIIPTLKEYYDRYPQYVDEEDIKTYPQLDPSIPTGQLMMRGAVRIVL